MKWAIFSDIHGNIHALEKVMENIKKEGVDRIFCLGDLVGYGAHPDRVIDLLKKENIPVIMGNYDEGVGFDRDDCGCAYPTEEEREMGQISLEWTQKQVSDGNKEFLRNLPRELREKLGPLEVLLVHGSPRKINEYLFSDRPEERVWPMLEKTGADMVICGHTHLPYYKNREGIHLINDGSVGKPKNGSPEAHYLLLEYREGLRITFRQVEYDEEAAAADIIAAGLPEKFAANVRTGRG